MLEGSQPLGEKIAVQLFQHWGWLWFWQAGAVLLRGQVMQSRAVCACLNSVLMSVKVPPCCPSCCPSTSQQLKVGGVWEAKPHQEHCWGFGGAGGAGGLCSF